ncbi:MAG: heparinase II/III-family protein [Clostridia bacterium]|nr:heparinase II/III-family protein [Clostridia bacterium]
MELFKRAKEKAFWKRVRTDQKYAALIESVKKIFEMSRTQPLASLAYSARKQFKATGSRHEFEKPYFMRRQYLTSSALLTLIYPEESRYLNELQDVIWATLEEFSWALPAHTANPWDLPADTCIDLFAVETGFSLAEICYLLSDRLDGEIIERLKAETERRIINSYLTRNFGWEKDKGNWAAVCAGCVAGTFMYLAPERFDSVSERIYKTMDCFLESFTDEGVCEEGLGYWQYGFGIFVWFADLLRQFTNGRKDYFVSDKVEKVASFAQKNFMCGNQVVSFSDSARNVKIQGALMSFLANEYPNSVHTLPDALTGWIYGNGISNDGNWIRCIRDFVYYDLSKEKGYLEKRNYDFIESGQVIINSEKYSLAIKANHNGEPHNHNDVGAFILSTEKGQIFCDFGTGRYTKEYFSEKRYDYLCTSSRGHSVPVINNAYQKAGKEYRGSIAHVGNEITAEIAGAYGQSGLESVTRRFRYCENKIELCDTFVSTEKKEYTDRFVTLIEPKVFDDHIIVENVKLSFDKDCVKPTVSSEQQAIHNQGGETETVYLIDFALNKGIESAKFVFEIV